MQSANPKLSTCHLPNDCQRPASALAPTIPMAFADQTPRTPNSELALKRVRLLRSTDSVMAPSCGASSTHGNLANPELETARCLGDFWAEANARGIENGCGRVG